MGTGMDRIEGVHCFLKMAQTGLGTVFQVAMATPIFVLQKL